MYKTHLRALIASAVIFSVFSAGAMATEYFVAQGHPAADDVNPGTAEKPFKTITAALPHIKAGDSLRVSAGVYREMVSLSRAAKPIDGVAYKAFATGTAAKPIHIAAVPGQKVVIKGTDIITGWTKHKDSIYVKDNWTHKTYQVFCDEQSLRQIAGDSGSPQNENAWDGKKGTGLADMEKGSFYVDPQAKRLYVWTPDGSDPATHEIEYGARHHCMVIDTNYLTVAGITMFGGNCALTGSFNTLAECQILWSVFCGLGISGQSHSIINCKINYNGNTGISTWGYGHRIIDSETSFNNQRLWSRHWHAGGMKNFSSDTLVSGCKAQGNIASPGIWFDGNNVGNTIQNCVVFHNTNGIFYEIGERAIIKNNVCYENYSRGIDLSSISYSIAMHNVCYKNGKAGIGLYGGSRRGDMAYEDQDSGTIATRGNVIWGNILMDNWHEDRLPKGETRDGPELIMPATSFKCNDGNISDYNLYYRSDNRPIRFWYNYKESSFDDLKAWQQATGQDKNSIVAQPLFANLAKYDFRPAPNSPAIMMVRPRLGIRLDADGNDRIYRNMQTAGPYRANPKLHPPARLEKEIPTGPVPMGVAAPIETPKDFVRELAEIPVVKDKETLLVRLLDTSFKWETPPSAVTVNKRRSNYKVQVGRHVKTLRLAQAVLNPGKGTIAKCLIVREDGMTIELKLEAGKNIGPSTGDWNGKLVQDPNSGKTNIGWQSKSGQSRIFVTEWINDNEWYPVREVQWILEDEAATVLIFGVTTE